MLTHMMDWERRRNIRRWNIVVKDSIEISITFLTTTIMELKEEGV